MLIITHISSLIHLALIVSNHLLVTNLLVPCSCAHALMFSSQRKTFCFASFSIWRVIRLLTFRSAFPFCLSLLDDENTSFPSTEGIRNFISMVPSHRSRKESFFLLSMPWLLLCATADVDSPGDTQVFLLLTSMRLMMEAKSFIQDCGGYSLVSSDDTHGLTR